MGVDVMEPSPPQLAERPSQGVLVFVGLAGVLSAIGAAAGGFLTRLSADAVVEYGWGNTLRHAAIFALIGGMLALCQHEIGVPIVVGSSASILAVVGTVLAGLHLRLGTLLDPYPVRGVLFIGAGIVALFGIAVGLAGLRGKANVGFGIPVVVLSTIFVGMTAALFNLDKMRRAAQIRPFLGFVVIALVCAVCSFVGRHGVFAASVAAATIVSLFIDALDFGDFRQPAAIANVVALTLIIVLGVAGIAAAPRGVAADADGVAERQWPERHWNDTVPRTTSTASVATGAATSSGPQPLITREVIASRATGETPVAAMATSDFAVTADELLSGHPLIAPYEPTSAMPQQSQYDIPTSAVSTIGQWAADPYLRHQLRFWDGLRWTEHVEDDGSPAIDPVEP